MIPMPPTRDSPPPKPVGDRAVYQKYLPLVRRIAMKTVRKLPSEITMDDVLGAGWMGLAEALGRHGQLDEEQFEAYASYRIRGAILDYLRSLDPLTRRMRNASRKVSEAIATLSIRLGRNPEEEEIAGELGLDVEALRTLLGQIAEADLARLELPGALEAEAAERVPEAIASRRELTDLVVAAIGEMPERMRIVLGLYYQEELSLREIGEVFDVTESRACQLHSEAIHRLRARLGLSKAKKEQP